MKLICPHCEKPFDLEQAIKEMEHREVADLAAKFGKAWSIVFEYSDCFRQSEYGSVPLKKRLRIFKEINSLFDGLNFIVKGKKYRTEWNTVLNAMTEICNIQKWGFRNHNYLKAVLVRGSDRLSAEGMTAKEEESRAVGSKQEAVGSKQGDPVAPRKGDITADEFCKKHGVKSLGEILKIKSFSP